MNRVDIFGSEISLDLALDGFDLDLIGFDCSDELLDEYHEDPKAFRWRCPFNPGCGAQSYAGCPMRDWRAKRALISNPPGRQQ